MSSLHSISNAPVGASMGFRILTNVSGTPTLAPAIGVAPTTAGVVEFHPSGALTSTYAVLVTQAGEYSIVWDNGGVLVGDDQPNLNSIAAGVPQTAAIAAAVAAAVPDAADIAAVLAASPVLGVTNPVTLSMTQVVPSSNTAQTVGDALNAARAQGFGKWAIIGTTLTLYAGNGTTVVHTFTLDSATAPTSRT